VKSKELKKINKKGRKRKATEKKEATKNGDAHNERKEKDFEPPPNARST